MATRTSLPTAEWNRLNRLLAQALELEGDARARWLDGLAEEDRPLRPLLADLLARSGAADFTETSDPPTRVARLATEALDAMRHEQPGDHIGPWRLDGLLAEGGMGAVWRAERADGVMQRVAALKLPRAEWVDHGLATRIARERAILARLQHPAIAVLYDAGFSGEGRPYLALEYVDGRPIDEHCKGRALGDVLRLFVEVTRAVAHAHAQLVIHRDLKPSNVLVTAEGRPKLLDFGISKLLEGEAPAAEATALTRLGGRPMTLAYAAPEQVLGLPVTVAADVYSLGVMLFELVAGARPYRADTARELEAELLRGDLRRPSEAARDPARVRLLKGDLDAIVLTALKRQPAERYESAAALADDLERYLAGKPVRARPDTRTYRVRKFVARHRLPVAAGVAVAVALGVGLGVALWQAREARQQASVAREQAERANAMSGFVLSLIQRADPQASEQTRAADLAMLHAIEERVDSEFAGSPDQKLQLRLTVGDAYRNRGEMAAARRLYQRAVDEAERQLSADDMLLLTAQVRASDPNLIVSNAASQQLDRVIVVLRAKEGAAAADLLIDALLIRHELDADFGVLGYKPAVQRFETLEEALQTAIRSFGHGSRQELKLARPYARAKWVFGRNNHAIDHLEHTLRRARQRSEDMTGAPEYHDALAAYAEHLCNDGFLPQALPILRRELEYSRKANGENSFHQERVLNALSACFVAVGDPGGLRFADDVFAVAAARERPPSTNLFRRAEKAMIAALRSRRDYAAAEFYYRRAIKNSAAVADPELRRRLMRGVDMDRVCLLVRRGDAEEAERFAAPLAAAADVDFGRHGRMTYEQGWLFECLALAQLQNGRHEQALRTARKLVERCLASDMPRAEDCQGRGFVAQAMAEAELGRHREALASVQKRLEMPHNQLVRFPDLAIAYGRALLADGRPEEALEPLRLAYGRFLSRFPDDAQAAEAEYWFALAYLAVGDPRGRWMLAEAKKALAASPIRSHRLLAVRPSP